MATIAPNTVPSVAPIMVQPTLQHCDAQTPSTEVAISSPNAVPAIDPTQDPVNVSPRAPPMFKEKETNTSEKVRKVCFFRRLGTDSQLTDIMNGASNCAIVN